MMNGTPGSQSVLRIPRPLLTVLGGLWVVGVGFGLRSMWIYENRPGSPAQPPKQSPSSFHSAGRHSRPTLLVIAHPRCPCTAATIEELARVVNSAPDGLDARVYFYEPADASAAWRQTGLWRTASSIPGVQVLPDVEGRTAHTLGAATSGQALLYGGNGRLLFSGGLTDSRGHSGESIGGRAILSLLSKPQLDRVTTAVYGCSLIAPDGSTSMRVIERSGIAP